MSYEQRARDWLADYVFSCMVPPTQERGEEIEKALTAFAESIAAEARLVDDLLLSERAAALGAAGDVVRGEWQARLREPEEERLEISSIQALERDVRSLSPKGWLGVRAEELAVMREAASCWARHIARNGRHEDAAAIDAAIARLP